MTEPRTEAGRRIIATKNYHYPSCGSDGECVCSLALLVLAIEAEARAEFEERAGAMETDTVKRAIACADAAEARVATLEAALSVERIAAAMAIAQDKVLGYLPDTHVASDYTILAAALRAALLAEEATDD